MNKMRLSSNFILHPSSFILHVTRSLPLAVLFALALSPQSTSPQTKTAESKSSDTFRRADGVPADSPKSFEFALGRFAYHVKANGNGQRTKGDDTRRFALDFGPGDDIKYLYFAGFHGGLLLTCEVLGEHGGTSYAVRLDQPSM